MGMPHEVHFHDRIREQNSLAGAAQLLAESSEALGWDHVAFFGDVDDLGLQQDSSGTYLLEELGWPKQALEDWARLKPGKHCPVARRCAKRSAPFLWSANSRSDAWGGQTFEPGQRQMLDHYGQTVIGGLAVPVRHAGGRIGYVSWMTTDRRLLQQRYADTLSASYLLSHAFIDQLDRFAPPVPNQVTEQSLLTVREIECLQWAARGKTEEEIAIIIGRSRETVHFHLRNVVNKLDANNRTHAAVIACHRGLISL